MHLIGSPRESTNGNSNGETYYSEFGGVNGGEWETLKYTISRTDVGLNLRYQVNRAFAVIPWADYTKINTNQIDEQVELVNGATVGRQVVYHRRFAADVELFWNTRPEVIYGLDIVYKVKRIELHLGSPLGYILSLGKKDEENDYVFESKGSINLSLSCDFKG